MQHLPSADLRSRTLNSFDKRFFDKAMLANGIPEKVTMDKSGANKAAIDEINADREIPMVVRQVKYLNDIVEPIL
jgi:transposase-like protein